uniref:Secreted protein n=1 Tax=Knipowitschia caucasica TaxID=637954 RepID=A0AAV2LRU9_KNICA
MAFCYYYLFILDKAVGKAARVGWIGAQQQAAWQRLHNKSVWGGGEPGRLLICGRGECGTVPCAAEKCFARDRCCHDEGNKERMQRDSSRADRKIQWVW